MYQYHKEKDHVTGKNSTIAVVAQLAERRQKKAKQKQAHRTQNTDWFHNSLRDFLNEQTTLLITKQI